MNDSEKPTWKADGRAAVIPFIVCENAMSVVKFVEDVFGAHHVRRPLMRSDGTLWNAEMRLDDGTLMISEASGEFRFPAFVYVQVPDVDATFQKAIAAGAREFMAPQDQFYGDRDGGVMDPSGNLWWIGTHKEDLSDDAIEAAARVFEERMRSSTGADPDA